MQQTLPDHIQGSHEALLQYRFMWCLAYCHTYVGTPLSVVQSGVTEELCTHKGVSQLGFCFGAARSLFLLSQLHRAFRLELLREGFAANADPYPPWSSGSCFAVCMTDCL